MRVSVHGWNRYVRETEIGNSPLSGLKLSKDESRTLSWDKYGLFPLKHQSNSFSGVEVHWRQDLKLTGNYRMMLRLSRSDILHLFRTVFGDELDVSLIQEHGFTVSSDLAKEILKTVKLTDLTLGELIDMNNQAGKSAPPPAPQETEHKRALNDFRRRL
jgi:hypothetical protein